MLQNIIILGLDFTNFEIGTLTIGTAVMTWTGLVIYKRYFFQSSWRKIYIITTLLGLFFSILQLLLIYQVNQIIGIPNIVFAFGDNTFC